MADHVDKVLTTPSDLERINRNRRLARQFLEVTAKPGKLVLPEVLRGYIDQGLTPEYCPACGSKVEAMYWTIGRFLPMPIYGARCPNAKPKGMPGA